MVMREQRSPCPHGDETCPCPDRYGDAFDPCHYEGDDPMPCPRTGVVGCMTCRRKYANAMAFHLLLAVLWIAVIAVPAFLRPHMLVPRLWLGVLATIVVVYHLLDAYAEYREGRRT